MINFLYFASLIFRKSRYLFYNMSFIFGIYFPALYLSYRRLKRINSPYLSWIINSDTDITIDGFPRSGNSYFQDYFFKCNPELNIAHHCHHPAQLIQSLKLHKPSVVLIRDPKGACCSLVALTIQSNQNVINVYGKNALRINYVPKMRDLLIQYILFYKSLIPYIDKLSILTLQSIIGDSSECIIHINSQCNKHFSSEISHTPISRDTPFHAVPSEQRDILKRKVNGLYENLDEDLKHTADRLYAYFHDFER